VARPKAQWLLHIFLHVQDREDCSENERIVEIVEKLRWDGIRSFTRGAKRGLNGTRIYKRSGFKVDVVDQPDGAPLEHISRALDFYEQPGVRELLDGLERSIVIAIKFLGDSTPDVTLDPPLLKRLSEAGVMYDLDLYLWNIPNTPWERIATGVRSIFQKPN
jgi:hypothetical protein